MNILPKKRWHVRTKENIARVRKDEAEAAEIERQEKLRIENADREARLSFLKQKSKLKLLEYGATQEIQEKNETADSEHINLFADIDNAVKTTNAEHDIEAKEKKEEYEKQIGYLTYLGQDTNEALGKKNWYEVAPGHSRLQQCSSIKETYNKLVLKDEDGKPKPKEIDIKNGEIGWKAKQKDDPLHTFKKNRPEETKQCTSSVSDCGNQKTKHIHGTLRKDKSDKKDQLQKLREARLKREQQEKHRTELFLTQLNNPKNKNTNYQKESEVKQKYNSQFNPNLARQNFR